MCHLVCVFCSVLINMMVFDCAFILFIIVCSGSIFLPYLLLFLDCHISNSIICIIVTVNFLVIYFVSRVFLLIL